MAQSNNVLIVGGSSGVGLATAKLALTNLANSNIIISSTSEEKLKKAVEEIKASEQSGKGIVDYIVGDVSNFDTQFDDVESILKAATTKFNGLIDHVVWTAGKRPAFSKNDSKPSNADIIQASSTRLFAPLFLGFLAKKYMTDSTRSSITLTSGVLVYRPRPGMGRMIAAAGGLESGTRGLAVDLAPIRVNMIVLGAIQTPLLDEFTGGNSAMTDHLAQGTLAKRIGSAEEAAEAYLFSMRCGYATGTRIDVDGGSLLC